MVLRINDNRIGILNANRRIVQDPSHFAIGGYWVRVSNPTPTTVYFGPKSLYFYVLPVGLARIDETLRRELEAIVHEAHVDAPIDESPPEVERSKELARLETNQKTHERVPAWNVQSLAELKQVIGENTGAGGFVINDNPSKPVVLEYPKYNDILPDVES